MTKTTYDFKRKRLIIQPVTKDGLLTLPKILVDESAWYQFVCWLGGAIRNILALVGLGTIIYYWLGG